MRNHREIITVHIFTITHFGIICREEVALGPMYSIKLFSRGLIVDPRRCIRQIFGNHHSHIHIQIRRVLHPHPTLKVSTHPFENPILLFQIPVSLPCLLEVIQRLLVTRLSFILFLTKDSDELGLGSGCLVSLTGPMLEVTEC